MLSSQPGLACGDTILVTLDKNCSAVVLPADVLQGSEQNIETYYVKILYPYDGYELNRVNQYGVFRYVVLAAKGAKDWTATGHQPDALPDEEVCWGYLQAEDKTPPVGCIRNVVGLHRLAVTYPAEADYFLTTRSPKEIAGQKYTYQPVGYEALECQDQVLGPGKLAQSSTGLLICTDIDSIFQQPLSWQDSAYAYFTGFPELHDNCGAWPPEVFRVTDRLLEFQCQAASVASPIPDRQITAMIERTFRIADEQGNQSRLLQKIFFFRPLIRLPDCKLELSSCTYPDAGEIAPLQIGSYPEVTNAVGMSMRAQGELCNFSIGYRDLKLPGPEYCGFKVIRTWEFLDWCFSGSAPEGNDPCPPYLIPSQKRTEWDQTIIVGTLGQPVVQAPPIYQYGKQQDFLTISCQAQECVAYFEVPPPLVDNRCSFDWTLEVLTEQPILWHGIPTGGTEKIPRTDIEITRREGRLFLGNLPKGFHHLIYRVKDFCEKQGNDTLKVLVLDQISPIVICNEELIVSLGKGIEEKGVGSVFAREASEGSWDNCGLIQIKVRRFILEKALEDFMAVSELAINPEPDTISTPIAKLNGPRRFLDRMGRLYRFCLRRHSFEYRNGGRCMG